MLCQSPIVIVYVWYTYIIDCSIFSDFRLTVVQSHWYTDYQNIIVNIVIMMWTFSWWYSINDLLLTSAYCQTVWILQIIPYMGTYYLVLFINTISTKDKIDCLKTMPNFVQIRLFSGLVTNQATMQHINHQGKVFLQQKQSSEVPSHLI